MGSDGNNIQPASAEDVTELRRRVNRLERELVELRQHSFAARSDPSSPPPLVAMTDAPALPSAVPLSPKTSLEDRIGSQLFNRIGIIALMIGMTWFLKYAIDSHWIGPAARIVIGFIAGVGVIVASERFRQQGMRVFSYSLKALGSGILYLSLWAAFQLYHLIPPSMAFAAMLLVTAWNGYMAWSQDAELLGAYALIGGFATPALLSTGIDNELFLFSYLFVIDLAAVALVRLKPWPRLVLAAFLPTVGYYTGWYFGVPVPQHPFALTVIFISLFFTLFASVSINVSPGSAADTSSDRLNALPDVLLPLANAAFTFAALYLLLHDERLTDWPPWLAVLLAALYLGLMRISRSTTAAAVHLSLAVTFLTLAIPLKASGRPIAAGWLVEGVALLWAAARLSSASVASQVRGVLRWLACGALALGFLAVVSMPVWCSEPTPAFAFINWRFGTSLIGIAAFGCAVWIAFDQHHKREASLISPLSSPTWLEIAAVSVVLFNLVFLWAVVEEIDTFWRATAGNADAILQRDLAVSGFLMLYGAVLLAAGFWKRSAFIRWQALILLVFTIGKTFLYDVSSLSQGYRVVSFLGLGALLLAVSFAYQKDWLGLHESAPASARAAGMAEEKR